MKLITNPRNSCKEFRKVLHIMRITLLLLLFVTYGLSLIHILIKPFWSPFVDLLKTKRWWVVSMQFLIGAGLAGIAFTIPMDYSFQLTLAIF